MSLSNPIPMKKHALLTAIRAQVNHGLGAFLSASRRA